MSKIDAVTQLFDLINCNFILFYFINLDKSELIKKLIVIGKQ
jgi:uncharacterized membrane-anchored protein YitT (DUF2179 family)